MSFFQPPLFRKFGKALDDLFSKKYGNKKELRVKSLTRDGTTLESGVVFSSKDGLYTGRFKYNRFLPSVGKAEVEVDTTGKAKGSIEADQTLAKNVVAKLTVSEKPDANAEIDYSKDSFNFSLIAGGSQKKSSVEGAGVIGFDGLSVGGSVKYDTTGQSVEDYNAGIQYQQADFTGTVRTEEQGDIVTGSYVHSLSREVDVGARLKYNIATGNRLFTFGGSYQVDSDTHARGKASSNGEVEAVLERRLANPSLTYALSSKFDANQKSHVPTEFGVLFQFGEK